MGTEGVLITPKVLVQNLPELLQTPGIRPYIWRYWLGIGGGMEEVFAPVYK